MSSDNSDPLKNAAISTTIAGVTFIAGAAIDLAIKQSTGKPSEAGKLGAVALLGAMHLNEASEILDGWTRS